MQSNKQLRKKQRQYNERLINKLCMRSSIYLNAKFGTPLSYDIPAYFEYYKKLGLTKKEIKTIFNNSTF